MTSIYLDLELHVVVLLLVKVSLIQHQQLVCSFFCLNTGAEMESQPTNSHLLAQCLHAGGLPERDGRAAHPQISPGYLHTDCRGVCVCVSDKLIYPWDTSLIQNIAKKKIFQTCPFIFRWVWLSLDNSGQSSFSPGMFDRDSCVRWTLSSSVVSYQISWFSDSSSNVNRVEQKCRQHHAAPLKCCLFDQEHVLIHWIPKQKHFNFKLETPTFLCKNSL